MFYDVRELRTANVGLRSVAFAMTQLANDAEDVEDGELLVLQAVDD